MLEIAFMIYSIGVVLFLISIVGIIISFIFKKKQYRQLFLKLLLVSLVSAILGIILALKVRGT